MKTLADFMATVTAGATPGRTLVSLGEALAYVTRKSAEHQAETWNSFRAGLSDGLEVGVGDRVDGRYPLVWVETSAVPA